MSGLSALIAAIRGSSFYRTSPPVVRVRRIAAIVRDRATVRVRGAVAPSRHEIDHDHLAMLLSWSLKEGSVAVDVGAHTGEVLDLILRAAPAGKHIAVEPLPHLHRQLAARYPSVIIHAVALGAADGIVELTEVVDSPGLSGLSSDHLSPTHETVRHTVPLRRLDDLIPLDVSPALIKIDVEGAEYGVLLGAMATLARCRPMLVFEHQKTSRDRVGADAFGVRPRQLHALLVDALGYRIFDIDGNGPLSVADFEARFESETMRNFVAHA